MTFCSLAFMCCGEAGRNPPPQFSAETPSLTLIFFIKGLREECVCTPSTTFQTMLLLPMRRVSSSPIYLSVTLLLHTWIYESISSLQQYSSLSTSPMYSYHTGCWYLCRQTLLLASSGQQGEVRHGDGHCQQGRYEQPTGDLSEGCRSSLVGGCGFLQS